MKAFLAVLAVLVSGSAAQYLYAHPYSSLGYNYGYNPLITPYSSFPITSYTAPAISHVIPGAVSTQYHSQDELGQFVFGHSSPGQSREESKTFDGTVRGSYSYVDPTGKVNQVVYKAGHDGFQILGANNLPVAPEAKLEPVKETPEVVAARAEFARKFEEAKEAALKAPEEIKSRRRRDVSEASKEESKPITLSSYTPLLPYYYNPVVVKSIDTPVISPYVSVLGKTTIKTSELKPIEDSKVPASTKLAEIKEVEKDIVSPISYTTPLAYSALPYSYSYPYAYSSYPYSGLPLSYSSYPYGYSPFLLKR